MKDSRPVKPSLKNLPYDCNDPVMPSGWAAITLPKYLGGFISGDTSSYDLKDVSILLISAMLQAIAPLWFLRALRSLIFSGAGNAEEWLDWFWLRVKRNCPDFFWVSFFFRFDPFTIVVNCIHPLLSDEFRSVVGTVQIVIAGILGSHRFPNVEGDDFTSNSQTQLSFMNIDYCSSSGEEGSS
ncbi:hypothetical protein Tco_0115743 [Tanacetum coccineum]